MLATYDLSAVRQFVTSLNDRRAGCNGEGMFCSDLDESLGCHVTVCKDLVDTVRHWAKMVYHGLIGFDPEVERVFKAELRRALDDTTPAVKHGRQVVNECFDLERLDELEWYASQIDTMLGNWVSPQRSVAPGPRTLPGDEADREIRERVAALAPLPPDWRPTDPRHVRLLEGRSAE